MNKQIDASKPRILIIDDNEAIHEDFRKILGARSGETALLDIEAAVFGENAEREDRPDYELDFALQGEQALTRVKEARAAGRPYSVAFIDIRMPPGWDGVETTLKIWQCDSDLQVVICTAYADYSWAQFRKKLGSAERFMILKKPFDVIEVMQLAATLTEKWRRLRADRRRTTELEQALAARRQTLSAPPSASASQVHAPVRTRVRQMLALEQQMRHGLQIGEFQLHYQPLIDTVSRRVVSLEALLRWQHPTEGAIPPARFIPVAEATGLILPLGEFVLRCACRQLKNWQRARVPLVPVAVNVSAIQLQSRNLREFVRQVLREHALSPQLLALELTESAVIKDARKHLQDLQALRKDGVSIEIDDFGTGYSSLSYLQQLPIDAIKIDRSFIAQLDTNAADETIVNAIIAMAHSLGLKVIAEGVETQGQFEALKRLGCEIAQGYFFSRPLNSFACGELLVKLAVRSSFTDTLRLEIGSKRAPTLSLVKK